METTVTLEEPVSAEACRVHMVPITEVLGQVGSKWTMYVIVALATGPRRFSELKAHIGGVSQKVLTSTLRDLERDGLVSRKVTPSIPPRVDYELTAMGQELRGPLGAIGRWAVDNQTRVQAARDRFAHAEDERRRDAW
jgi:DNA-binding HxlR family transcriptional regulator